MITDAIISLYPGNKWSIIDEDYDTLDWDSKNPSPKPTLQELTDEVNRLKSINDSKEYQRQRAAEYPSIVDQLDTLYHGGYDAWKETIQQIKNKYPKP